MKKFLISVLLFVSVICISFTVQAAVITSEYTDSNGTVHITVSPGGEDDTAVLRGIMINNSSSPIDLTLTSGEYNLTATIPIFNNTTINASSATIKQTSPGKGILINANCLNGVGTPSGKYSSLKNVTINGGMWVGTSSPDTSKTYKSTGCYVGYSTFLFMHAKNITIKNLF
ncbi:MAG: hypothetical protein LUG95_05025 [Clostridiales bacterium]|nr:hypothetical protein [Clostridiales bacterium]